MSYQTSFLPRPRFAQKPTPNIVPIERVRPLPSSKTDVQKTCADAPMPRPEREVGDLVKRLETVERALAQASKEADRWRARTQTLQSCISKGMPSETTYGPQHALPTPLSPSLASLLAVVQTVTGRSPAMLIARDRSRDTAKARHILFWLARRTTSLSLPTLARRLHRNHATILHSIARCDTIALALNVTATPQTCAQAARRLWEAEWE